MLLLCRYCVDRSIRMTTLATTKILTTNKSTIMDGNATLHASKRLATIVAVMTLTFGLFTAQSQAAGVWTNEPAGASVVVDCPFNSVGGCGILDAYSSSQIVSDGSAPISPSSVVKSTFSAGNTSGGMQLNYVTPQIQSEMYVGLIWRTNPEFQGNPGSYSNKMFFIRGPGANGLLLMYGPSGGPHQAVFGHNTGGGLDNSHVCSFDLGLICYPNVNIPSAALPRGTWTKLEMYVKKSTTNTSRDGIVRWWVNGVLVGNYTTLNYAGAGLNEWVWSEAWDGTFNPNHVEWNHFIDHLHVSIPNGGGSTDQPPGPPASPSIRSVTAP